MIENLPFYISLIFGLTTLLTVALFVNASSHKIFITTFLILWIVFQTVESLSGYYLITNTYPPHFIFLVLPMLLIIAACFLSSKGKIFINGFDLKKLTWLHTIRIPVEVTLLLLFLNGKVPRLMTFEGRNFDVLSGITAPIIALLVFKANYVNKKLLLVWNFICLGLLLNIIINAVLSAPFPFQQFGFEQPNVAILYFPFVLLPAVVVPIVLFSHLISIRQLLKKQ